MSPGPGRPSSDGYLHQSECMHHRCSWCVCACHRPSSADVRLADAPCPHCVVQDERRTKRHDWTRYRCPTHGHFVIGRFPFLTSEDDA